MIKVDFIEKGLELKKTTYLENDNLALVLVDGEDEIYTYVSVNTDEVLPEDEAFVKDYSENRGVLEALDKAGAIVEPKGYKPSGHVLLPCFKFKVDEIEELV